MALAFEAAGTAVSGTASSATVNYPGTPSGQLLLTVFGFENVAAGSGPWVSSSVGGDWSRTFYQAPTGGNGCGLEVWNTHSWTISNTNVFNFAASYSHVAQGLVYTGQFFDGGITSPVRASSSQAWSGNNPATPTIYSFADELLLAAAADTLASPGYGTPVPAGSTSRFDSKRSAFGNVEITAADKLGVATGTTGPFVWTATAAGLGRGAAGVLAVRPASVAPSTSAVLEAPMPPILDLPDGYVVSWSAIDPATGADVPGVSVSGVSIYGQFLGTGAGGGGGSQVGPYMLVPGPGA